jgi:hypothetical protein
LRAQQQQALLRRHAQEDRLQGALVKLAKIASKRFSRTSASLPPAKGVTLAGCGGAVWLGPQC